MSIFTAAICAAAFLVCGRVLSCACPKTVRDSTRKLREVSIFFI
jgi:hypothetical protein